MGVRFVMAPSSQELEPPGNPGRFRSLASRHKAYFAPVGGKGRVKLVNVAEYEEAVGQAADLARDLGHATRRNTLALSSSPGDPVYTAEQARRMAYQADREKIALGRDLELLVPVDQLAGDAVRIFSAMIRPLDRLEAQADALSLAVSQGGTTGARAFLKGIKIEIRNLIADSLSELHKTVTREPPCALEDFTPITRSRAERMG